MKPTDSPSPADGPQDDQCVNEVESLADIEALSDYPLVPGDVNISGISIQDPLAHTDSGSESESESDQGTLGTDATQTVTPAMPDTDTSAPEDSPNPGTAIHAPTPDSDDYSDQSRDTNPAISDKPCADTPAHDDSQISLDEQLPADSPTIDTPAPSPSPKANITDQSNHCESITTDATPTSEDTADSLKEPTDNNEADNKQTGDNAINSESEEDTAVESAEIDNRHPDNVHPEDSNTVDTDVATTAGDSKTESAQSRDQDLPDSKASASSRRDSALEDGASAIEENIDTDSPVDTHCPEVPADNLDSIDIECDHTAPNTTESGDAPSDDTAPTQAGSASTQDQYGDCTQNDAPSKANEDSLTLKNATTSDDTGVSVSTSSNETPDENTPDSDSADHDSRDLEPTPLVDVGAIPVIDASAETSSIKAADTSFEDIITTPPDTAASATNTPSVPRNSAKTSPQPNTEADNSALLGAAPTKVSPKLATKLPRRWIVSVAVAAVLVLLLAGFAGMYAYYHKRALPGTTISGVSICGMNRTQVNALLEGKQSQLRINITGSSKPAAASLTDLGQQIDIPATVKRAFDKNKSWWRYPLSLFTNTKIKPAVNSDPNQLYKYAATLISGPSAKTPVNANIIFDNEAATFTIAPDQNGYGADPLQLNQAAQQALATLRNTDINITPKEVPARIKPAELQNGLKQANNLIKPEVTITADDSTFKATAADRAAWIKLPTIDPKVSPSVDPVQIQKWVKKQAGSVSQDPVPGQRNVNAKGQTTLVISDPVEGRHVTNTEQTSDSIVSSIRSGKNYQGKFSFDKTPAPWKDKLIAPGAEDLAYQASDNEKWIDVNLSNHTVTAFIGATPVYGPVYMVNGAPLTPTVTGTFSIYLKLYSQTMRGVNTDGSKYVTEDVPWVMYFHSGYALHGAYWRSSFGYAGSGGSHGCVNMEPSQAEHLYDWAPIGTVVVSHY